MGPFLTVTREDSVPHDYSNNSGHETFVSLQEEEFHFFVPNLHINFHRRLRLDRAAPRIPRFFSEISNYGLSRL